QSSINTATRHPTRRPHSTSGREVCRVPHNYTPGPSNLPSARLESGSPDEARNNPMIDPAKATKGRRMSKKTRKKPSTPGSGKPARGKSAAPTKTAAPKTRAAAKKPGGKAGRQASGGRPKASHNSPPKRLKAAGSRAAAVRALIEG